MTGSQRKWLTEYLGECWIEHDNPNQLIYVGQIYLDKSTLRNRTFTDLKDKQDLLEAVIAKGEWFEFEAYSTNIHGDNDDDFFNAWLIKLSPIETAELVCWWKGVE